MRFRKEDGTIINTKTDIPDNLLIKKGLKRYVLDIQSVPDTEQLPEEEISEDDYNYSVTQFEHYHVNTFEENKTEKIISLRNYVKPKFPSFEEQLTALIGETYDKIKEDKIKQDVKNWNKYIDDFKSDIEDCATQEELDAIEYRLPEDIEEDGTL